MSIYGIDHVQLAIPKGGESVAIDFYQGLLGLNRIAKPPHLEARGGCWFSNGVVSVHVGVDDDFRPSRKAHPALLVKDLDAFAANLSAGGTHVYRDQPLEGYKRCYIDDPFGNRIELMERI